MMPEREHTFHVTVETREPVSREDAQAALLYMLNRGRRGKDDEPKVKAEAPDA